MTRVLYVTGWCRSGSTVLCNVLGELPGVVHAGELHYLWRNGVLGIGTNTTCGCGEQVRQCPLWRKVIESVAGPDPEPVAREAVADLAAALRTRHTRARLREALGGPMDPVARRAVARMADTYHAIAAATSARLIIDSSKYPAEAAALLGRDDLDVKVLHLVREPRASAYSWVRPKEYIPAMGVVRSTAYWTAFNAASDHIGRSVAGDAVPRYLRLRYEDFVARPRETLTAVLRLCGLPDDPPISDRGEAVLGLNHTVTGNPDRLRQGPVRLVLDEAWRSGLPWPQRVAAGLVAGPLARRYGYR